MVAMAAGASEELDALASQSFAWLVEDLRANGYAVQLVELG